MVWTAEKGEEELEKDRQSLRRVVKLPRNTQVRLAIISYTGHTRNNKYTASYSSEEMKHKINVIRGPGGCFPYLLMYLMLNICQGLSALGPGL